MCEMASLGGNPRQVFTFLEKCEQKTVSLLFSLPEIRKMF